VARAFAKKIAEELASQYPDLMTIEVSKEKRLGRVFVDYLRNGFAQTAVAPYSVRAIEGAPVAMPIEWVELGSKKITTQSFTIKNALQRIALHEDKWKDISHKPYSIKKLAGELKKL